MLLHIVTKSPLPIISRRFPACWGPPGLYKPVQGPLGAGRTMRHTAGLQPVFQLWQGTHPYDDNHWLMESTDEQGMRKMEGWQEGRAGGMKKNSWQTQEKHPLMRMSEPQETKSLGWGSGFMALTPPGRQSGRRGRLTLWNVRETLQSTQQTFGWAQGLVWICEDKCLCFK